MSLRNALDFAFFNLDLFFCAISRANIWVRTFIYNFVIEARSFGFRTPNNVIEDNYNIIKCYFYYKVFLYPNFKIFLYNKKNFLHILRDGQ